MKTLLSMGNFKIQYYLLVFFLFKSLYFTEAQMCEWKDGVKGKGDCDHEIVGECFGGCGNKRA